MPWRKHAINRAVGALQKIALFIIALLGSSNNINPSPIPSITMGISTCTTTAKDKPTSRTITATAATPKECRSKQLSKSPCSVNVISLLAEINLPVTQFNNVLEALHPSNSTTDNGLNKPCHVAPPIDKNNQVTSPTGVDTQAIGFPASVDNVSPQANKTPQGQTSPESRCVHINATTTSLDTATTTTGTSKRHQSILLSANNSNPPTPEAAPEEMDPTSKTKPSKIYDQDQMLL
jgi:hypothetical protein